VSYLLDTNVCIGFLSGADSTLRDRLATLRPEDVVLCSVVKAELLYGARNSGRVAANLEKLKRFFEPFESLVFDDRAAEHYGSIRAQLKREGTPIGGNDLLIAAISLAADATLVTHNEGEFRRVAGLRVETW
jgi:tRNA(fMet)-specific endonuclease VapC